jgi:hypothetical protein
MESPTLKFHIIKAKLSCLSDLPMLLGSFGWDFGSCIPTRDFKQDVKHSQGKSKVY